MDHIPTFKKYISQMFLYLNDIVCILTLDTPEVFYKSLGAGK